MNQTYMKEQPIPGLILKMSLPMILSMLVNSLYNIVDSFFVAKISENAMTALSLVFPIQNLINAVMIGFGVGINAVIAFYLGAQKQKTADQTAGQGLTLATIHGIVLTAVCILIISPFLQMFTSDRSVVDLGIRYSRIVFSFSVIFAWELVFEKIFQAVGRMTASMVCMVAGCVANIILDPLFIFGAGPLPAMGIEGAALATGLGQTISFVLYLILYVFRPIPVKIRKENLHPGKFLTKQMYSIGISASLNMALPSLLISVLNIILGGFSQIYVFVLGVYYKLQTFLYLPANGVIQGMRPLIGYNYGAKEHKRVRNIYFAALLLILGIMTAGTLLCLLFPKMLIGLFTTNAETISIGASALRIICCGFMVSSVSVTSCGALEGLGKGAPSLMISLCRYVFLILPAARLLSRFMGADGVWHAFWITEALTAGISAVIYKKSVSLKSAKEAVAEETGDKTAE